MQQPDTMRMWSSPAATAWCQLQYMYMWKAPRDSEARRYLRDASLMINSGHQQFCSLLLKRPAFKNSSMEAATSWCRDRLGLRV